MAEGGGDAGDIGEVSGFLFEDDGGELEKTLRHLMNHRVEMFIFSTLLIPTPLLNAS